MLFKYKEYMHSENDIMLMFYNKTRILVYEKDGSIEETIESIKKYVRINGDLEYYFEEEIYQHSQGAQLEEEITLNLVKSGIYDGIVEITRLKWEKYD